jgi:phospholipase C
MRARRAATSPWRPAGDYIPHHEPFQYYASTANPTHARPSSPAMIGRTDVANHQYDLTDFFTARRGATSRRSAS